MQGIGSPSFYNQRLREALGTKTSHQAVGWATCGIHNDAFLLLNCPVGSMVLVKIAPQV
jgi:hypothetical protein